MPIFAKFTFVFLKRFILLRGEPELSIYEPVLNGGSVDYSQLMDIVRNATKHLKNMNKCDWSSLHDISKPEFMQTFADDIAELWRIHPFREGNTHTIMTFMTQFASEHGFTLDYNLFTKNPEFVRKSLIVATYNETKHLTHILTDSCNAILDRESEKRMNLTIQTPDEL